MKLSPARQIAIAVLALAFVGLQYRLWFGQGSLRDVAGLKHQVSELQAHNKELAERNRLLAADVHDLKNGNGAIAEIARKDLGMIGDGETFFLIVPPKKDPADNTPPDAAHASEPSDNDHASDTSNPANHSRQP